MNKNYSSFEVSDKMKRMELNWKILQSYKEAILRFCKIHKINVNENYK